jgi:hypothetical protein
MKSGLAIVMATSLLALGAMPALAQSPWPQAEPQQSAPAPWPQAQPAPQAAAPAGPSPWDAPAAPPQQRGPDPWSQPPAQQQASPQENKCVEQFLTLRKDVEKHGSAIQNASQKKQKPSPQEACGLFNSFTAAEKKMYAYASKNQAECGIPPQVIAQMKDARGKSDDIRTRVCQAAAQGPAPPQQRAPSLSDALSSPVPNSSNTRTGRGTFDTLTGSNPLTR